MKSEHEERVARLVAANTPEKLALAYLKARARAETAERALKAAQNGNMTQKADFEGAQGKFTAHGSPDVLDALSQVFKTRRSET